MKTKIKIHRLDGSVDVYITKMNKTNYRYKISEIMFELFPEGTSFFFGFHVIVDGAQVGSNEMPSFPIKKIDIICLKSQHLSYKELAIIYKHRNNTLLSVY